MRRGRDDLTKLARKADIRAGEMRERVRAFDWASTPLGPADAWSERLNWIVELMLASDFPMAVRWGPQLIQIYNDAYAPLLGNKHPGALGRPLREVYPEIYDRLGPLNEAILRGERASYFAEDHAWTVERKGVPENANFTISYSPVADPAAPNGIGGILITTFETTERVHNEEKLRTLTGQLEAQVQQRTRERDRIWQVSEDLLAVSNFDGYFTSVNPAWRHLLGWSDDEIKSMHVSQLRHPDDAALATAGRKRLADGVPTVRMENRFRHRDGSWRWIHWTMTADDDLIYVAGRHVSTEKSAAEALRRSEQQFRALVAGVTDYAFIMLDTKGIVASWNAGAARIKGYAASEIIGRHFSQFYTDEDRAAGLPTRALSMAAAGKFETEAWRVRKDGSRFWAHVVIDPIRETDGTLVGFAKITRDITERRKVQEALERAQAQLAQAQKMEALGQLTGGVAHDFNNLLMIVSGQAQALLRRLSDKPNVRSLEAILIATSRGEALTRQLLTFARRQPMDPRTVSPEWTFAAFRDVLESSVPGNIELRIEIPPDTGAVSIDIPEFELVLVNLVVNARDAMPKGGTITVTARDVTFQGYETPERLTGEFVAFTVADTGSGIPPEVLPKIFEPFFSTKAPGKGTGLGLSQAYGFAHQSGGAIAVASEVGRGTAITIYLPRSHSPLAAEKPKEPAAAQSLGSGETILVVEDNPDVQNVVLAMLEQLNYRVHAVDTVAAALELIAADTPIDLILSDVVLPGEFDGLALARIVQERFPHIPVLLTSGYAKALSGRHDLPILRKPYQIAALAKAIRENLDRKRSTQAAAAAQPPSFTGAPK
jgi:PAS domain S-box-containing protein